MEPLNAPFGAKTFEPTPELAVVVVSGGLGGGFPKWLLVIFATTNRADDSFVGLIVVG